MRALERRDMTLAGAGTYFRNTTAVKTALLALRGVRPDAIIVIGAYLPSAVFTQWARKLGVDALIVNISFVGANALADALGPAGEGVYVTQVVPFPEWRRDAVLAEYRAALAVHDPLAEPGFGSLEGYIAGRLTVDVLRRLGPEPTRAAFLGALAGVGAFDIGGFALRYGPGDNRGSDQVFLTMIRGDGSIVPVEAIGPMSAPDVTPHRRSRLGLSAKLYLAIAGAVALTLVASIVAWLSFVELGQHQRRITREHIPSITDSLRLAQQSTLIAATAPALIAATDEKERARVMASLRQQAAVLDGLITRLAKEMGGDVDLPEDTRMIGEINKASDKLTATLDQLDDSVGRQLALRTELDGAGRPGRRPSPAPDRAAHPPPRRRDALFGHRVSLAQRCRAAAARGAFHRAYAPDLCGDVAAQHRGQSHRRAARRNRRPS